MTAHFKAGLLTLLLCLSVEALAAFSVNPNTWAANQEGSNFVSASLTANVATIVCAGAHGFAVNDVVIVTMTPADANYDGSYVVTAVTATTFSYARVLANIASAAKVGYARRGVQITNASLTTNVVTITTSVAHGYAIGNVVTITDANNPVFDGIYTITGVAATTFTYARTNADIAAVGAGGYVTRTSANLEVVELVSSGATFGGATGVTFDGMAGTDFFLNTAAAPHKISVRPPPHAKGSVTVTITGTAETMALGFSYTASNRNLQVSIKITLAKDASIAWDAGTSNSDLATAVGGGIAHPANNILPFDWFVYDPEFGAPSATNPAQSNPASTYSTDVTVDTANAKTLNVIVGSRTGSQVRIDAIGSDTVPASGVAADAWLIGLAAPAANTFRITAQIDAQAAQILERNIAKQLRAAAAPAGGHALKLTLETPATANTAGVQQTSTVSLIAVAP